MDDTDSELLRTLLKCFDRAMLVSRCGATLRARPMTVVQTPESRHLWLLCGLFGEDFAELDADSHVNVVMNDGLRFLSVTGSARVARPAAPSRRGSQRRPSLVLLEVTPQVAEYWDRSTSNGVRFAADAAEERRPPPAERSFGARAVGDGDAGARKLPRRRGPFDNVIPLERPKWRR